jgi:hypothetical protein
MKLHVIGHSFKSSEKHSGWEGTVTLSNEKEYNFIIFLNAVHKIFAPAYEIGVIDPYIKDMRKRLTLYHLKNSKPTSKYDDIIRKNIIIGVALFGYEYECGYHADETWKGIVSTGNGPLGTRTYVSDLAFHNNYNWQIAALNAIAQRGMIFKIDYEQIVVGHISRDVVSMPTPMDVFEVLWEFVEHLITEHEEFKYF